MKRLVRYLNSQTGAAAAEYALILGIVGAVIAAALVALQSDISAAINNIAGML